jgi:hypothetical protein
MVYASWGYSNIYLSGRSYAEKAEGISLVAVLRIHNSNLLRLALSNREAERVICVGSALADIPTMTNLASKKSFAAKLTEQGFNVPNIGTPEELEQAKHPPGGKVMGDWGGPWQTQYR